MWNKIKGIQLWFNPQLICKYGNNPLSSASLVNEGKLCISQVYWIVSPLCLQPDECAFLFLQENLGSHWSGLVCGLVCVWGSSLPLSVVLGSRVGEAITLWMFVYEWKERERNYNHRDFKIDLLPRLNTWTDNFTNHEKVKKQYARSKVGTHRALGNVEPKISTHSDSPMDKSYLSLIFWYLIC